MIIVIRRHGGTVHSIAGSKVLGSILNDLLMSVFVPPAAQKCQ